MTKKEELLKLHKSAYLQILLKTDWSINNKVYDDIAQKDEFSQYKRKKARELMQLQADAFFKHQKNAL